MLSRLIFVIFISIVGIGAANAVSAQGLLTLLNATNDSDVNVDTAALETSEADELAASVEVPMPMGTKTLVSAQTEAQRFREELTERWVNFPDAINEVIYILRASSPTGETSVFGEVVLYSCMLFFVGWLVERYVFGRFIGRRFVKPLIKEEPIGYTDKLPFLLIRGAFGVVGILISILIAYVLGLALFGTIEDTAVSFTALSVNTTYFGIRVAWMFWRMILAPFITQYRIPPFSDSDATRLFYWLAILATLDMTALNFTAWIARLGLNYNVFAFFAASTGLLMAIGHTSLILANRRSISLALCRGLDAFAVGYLLRFISVIWAPLLIIYIVVSWADLVYRLVMERATALPPILAAYSVLITMLLVYAFFNYGVEKFFNRRKRMIKTDGDNSSDPEAVFIPEAAATASMDIDNDGDEEGGHSAYMSNAGVYPPDEHYHPIRSYRDLAHRVVGIVTLTAGVYIAGSILGAREVFMGDAPLDRLLDVMVIMFIGYIGYHAFRIWTDEKIREEAGPEAEEVELGDEGGAASASRLATLLPLFRNTVLIIIVITCALIALLELGVNVSPLFAGAGVVGIAIGFGAQSLVRDIFSGAFFLFDDAFRKGEYIDIGSVKGTVENISIRSFQLRHHLGPLHTIPFGEIQFLTNYSRDWVIMKLPLRVTYDTDVEAVRKMIKKLGIELLDDPIIGHNFIQPLKSQGVIEMQDSAMIIRVKFMTKPGDQWLVRKKVYQDIRELFEREGVKFAHREVTVRLAEGAKAEGLSAEDVKAVGAAALQALDEDTIAAPPTGDTR